MSELSMIAEEAVKRREADDKKYAFLDALSPEQKELLRGEYIKFAIFVAFFECFLAIAFLALMINLGMIKVTW